MSPKQRTWIFWGLAAVCVGMQCVSILLGWPIQSKVLQTLRLWTWLFYFSFGGEIAKWLPSVESKIGKQSYFLMLVLLTVGVIVYQYFIVNSIVCFEGQRPLQVEYFYDSIIVTILWVGTLFAFIKRCDLKRKTRQTVSCFSRLTLGVYCSHLLVRDLITHFVGMNLFASTLLVWFAVTLVSITLVEVLRRLPFGR
ncbi:acyltransferase family protein [Clostridium transplantifaecale]|uniref:acyltransferase family protein n=1 Tax=Clostridium transplantifaecale TaxID=2479838 RepID=UPI000F635347